MKAIQFFIVCLMFCIQAIAQTPVPSVSFDPISVKSIAAPAPVYAVDPAGNLYSVSYDGIRKTSPDGTTTHIAGTSTYGYKDGPGATAQFGIIKDLALDAAGNMYVTDYGNSRIRKITPDGMVSTLAGSGNNGHQDGTGTAASFFYPHCLVADKTGVVYVWDEIPGSIRKITPEGVVTTILDDIPNANSIAIDPFGNLYLDAAGTVKKISPAGQVSVIDPSFIFGVKSGVATDRQGNVYTSNFNPSYGYNIPISVVIYKYFPGGGAVTLAGSLEGSVDSIGTDAQFQSVSDVFSDGRDNIYVPTYEATTGSYGIRKLSKPQLSFASSAGAPSPAKYFAISGNFLTSAASLQAPVGYELSLNEAGPWSATLNVPASAAGEIMVRKIYIRMAANTLAGHYNDSVVLSANGATVQKLGVSGTVTNSPKKLVIIGSGTSACIGVNPVSDCYVTRLSSYYNKLAPPDTAIDNSLARGSTNCYNGMPSSYVSPYPVSSGYTPLKDINITAALALHPDAILVNYPTNAYDVLPVNEIMFCLRTIRDSANKQGVPCYITTTQPRTSPSSFNTPAMKLKLAALKDSILSTFGTFAIDFWTGLINPADSSLLYDANDHINMNAAGHNILFQRVLNKNVFAVPAASIGNGTGLLGAYFGGTRLGIKPYLTRVDPVINNSFPTGTSPLPGVFEANNYSIRWTGKIQTIFSGTYTFYTVADDGVRLWVNGVQLVNNWVNQGATEKSGSITLVGGQKYDIVMEYYQAAGDAVSKLLWSAPGIDKAIIPKGQLYPQVLQSKPAGCVTNISPANGSVLQSANAPTLTWKPIPGVSFYTAYIWETAEPTLLSYAGTGPDTSFQVPPLHASTRYSWYVVAGFETSPNTGCLLTNASTFTTAAASTGSGTGLQGVYYNGTAFAGVPLLTRTDPTINFEFTYAHQPLSPAPGIVPDDNYSVRWTGYVQTQYSETYTFYTLSDDGIRLWVNGVKLVDNWTNHGATENSGSITLVAGQKYEIMIEYFEGTGEAITKLSWSSLSTPKQIVPKVQLYPPASATRMDNDLAVQEKISPSDASAFAFTTARLNPNPVKRGQPARLQINSNRTGAAIVKLMSSNGTGISNQRINLVKGVNTININTGALAQGLYLTSITGGDKPIILKLVID